MGRRRGGALVGAGWLQLIEKLPNPVAEPECHGYISRWLYQRHGFAVRDDLLERRLGPAPYHAGDAG